MFREEVFHEVNIPALLVLLRVPGCGPRMLARLQDLGLLPDAILHLPAREWQSLGFGDEAVRVLKHPPWDAVDSELRWLEQSENHLVTYTSSDYPVLLREIADPPPVLYVLGQLQSLSTLQLGMVGSRNPTADGKRLAGQFSSSLVACGLTVTSGLAIGIDSCSHRGALEAGGETVAVLGNGLRKIYPHRNTRLAESVAESGALVSEFPLEYAPKPGNFPRRNRIISGMSVGVLVIEATLKSGSLITARCAMEQGREVFAVPGAIHNPMTRGCHQLIRDGAKLVEQVEDITEEIGPLACVRHEPLLKPGIAQKRTKGLDVDAKVLLDNIGHLPIDVDTLVESTGIAVDTVTVIMLNLEFAGFVESLPGGKYIRKSFES